MVPEDAAEYTPPCNIKEAGMIKHFLDKIPYRVGWNIHLSLDDAEVNACTSFESYIRLFETEIIKEKDISVKADILSKSVGAGSAAIRQNNKEEVLSKVKYNQHDGVAKANS